MKRKAAASLAMLTFATASIAQLPYAIPSGWTRSANQSNGLVTLVPSGLPAGRVVALNVFNPESFTGSPVDYHNEIIRRAMQGVRLVSPAQHGAAGSFLATAFRGVTPQGITLWTTIYTARWADQGEATFYTANAQDLSQQYGPAVLAMVQSIAVPQSPAPAAGAARQMGNPLPSGACRSDGVTMCPKPVPSGDRVVELAGAYLATAATTGFSVGSGVQSRVSTTILLLYKNGVAVRTAAIKNGSMDDTYWAEGIATIDPNDITSISARRAGHWSESNGQVRVDWTTGGSQVFARDGDKLKEQYTTWAPYRSIDGLRLEGRFARIIEIPPPFVLTLHKDGTFVADNVNNTMGGSIVMPYFPEHGTGTYEISRWSLILRFSTGYVQSINLMLGPGDPSAPATLILNGFDFKKQ